MLKKIECFIPDDKLEDIKRALIDCGVEGMSVTEVRGFGRQQVNRLKQEEKQHEVSFSKRIKMEIVLREEDLAQVISEIKRLAWTGTSGDGKIFVLPVEDAIRISTDEVGLSALY